jgi:hypothetical protein
VNPSGLFSKGWCGMGAPLCSPFRSVIIRNPGTRIPCNPNTIFPGTGSAPSHRARKSWASSLRKVSCSTDKADYKIWPRQPRVSASLHLNATATKHKREEQPHTLPFTFSELNVHRFSLCLLKLNKISTDQDGRPPTSLQSAKTAFQIIHTYRC